MFQDFAQRKTVRGSAAVGRQQFRNVLAHIHPSLAATSGMDRIFYALDQDADNRLDFRELIFGLSVLAKGTVDEKLELLFKSFDVGNTGFISKEDLVQLLREMYNQVSYDPLMATAQSVEAFVDSLFVHYSIPSKRISLQLFKQAAFSQPRLMEALLGIDDAQSSPNKAALDERTQQSPQWSLAVEALKKELKTESLPLSTTDASVESPLLNHGHIRKHPKTRKKHKCCHIQ